MNIALIGVPGSGKTSLAYRLRRHIEDTDDCGCDPATREVVIVDNYISEIEQETDLALGPISGYLGNLYVALGRYARERRARSGLKSVITCGTLIETAVYSAMQFVSLAEVITEEDQAIEAPRIESMLRILAVLYRDVVQYDHAFYLPPRDSVDEDARYMDQQLQVAIQGFRLLPVVPLVNRETQLEDAVNALFPKVTNEAQD